MSMHVDLPLRAKLIENDLESRTARLSSPFYVKEGQTALEVNVWSTMNLQDIRLRMTQQLPDGSIQTYERTLRTSNNVSPIGSTQYDQFVILLTECFILALTLSTDVNGSAGHGRIYAQVSIRKNDDASQAKPEQLICSGYVTGFKPLAFPSSLSVRSPWEGPPRIKTIVITDPAAGAEMTQAVPNGVVWKIKALYFVLTTDVTVANRFVNVVFSNGINDFAYLVYPTVQPASLVRGYTLALGCGYSTPPGDRQQMQAPDLYLPGGYVFRTVTGNMQAADAYSTIACQVEEYIAGI